MLETFIRPKKPNTPGTRHAVDVVTKGLHKDKPHSPLVVSLNKSSGRNNKGQVTVRHRGGGHKRLYRIIDFRRNKDDIPAIVERFEYDPNRSAHIALLLYKDGERRYIIAPRQLKTGAELVSGVAAPIRIGNALPLSAIPVGTVVHCVEMKPGKGAQIGRSAGAGIQLIA
ncbi:MAG TPA: 50S ribosomal protein L2, partial [Gammaproteobacteria bacterium]|nr:50S ribosomal protein L2 [Gammaproteobacteria bacterium]